MPQGQIADGQSYASILRGGNFDANRPLYWHNWAPRPTSTGDIFSSSIRVGDYKLVDLFADGKQELYNLKNDEGERKNIAAENPEMTKKLYAQLNNWRNGIGITEKTLEGLGAKADKRADRKGDKKEQRKEERKVKKEKN